MSAFILSDAHLSALVRYASRNNLAASVQLHGTPGHSIWRIAGREDETIQMLKKENAASVAYRYEEAPDVSPVVYNTGARLLSHIEAIKAAQCFEYQSCEHPQWHESAARSVCEAITSHAVRHLPGYDAAPWAIY